MSKPMRDKKTDYKKLLDEACSQLKILKTALCMINKNERIDLYDYIDKARDFLNQDICIDYLLVRRMIALEEYLKREDN